MRIPTLVVLLGGQPMGEVRRPAAQRMEFRYESDYVTEADALPLSVSMPLFRRTHPDRVITPWLWGLLPDNEDVRRAWAKDQGVPWRSAFDLLATPIGHDCPGAVQLCPPTEVNWLAERGGGLNPLNEHGVAERLRALQRDESAWWDKRLRLQFSLGGGQAKTALHFANGEWSAPWGGIPTTHILKPSVRGLRRTEINEHLCLTAARTLGLPAARTSVRRFEDQVAVVVRRFDRVDIDGDLHRFHQEDLCQALSINPGDKYEIDGGPGASDISGVLRKHASIHSEEDVERFVDCLALNWLLGAPDAHAKNYSLLIEPDHARLAPLYDVISGLPYWDEEDEIPLAMRVGSRLHLGDIYQEDWLDGARAVRVDPGATIERTITMASLLPGAVADAAQDPAVREVDAAFADEFVDTVSDRAKECVKRLEGPPLGLTS